MNALADVRRENLRVIVERDGLAVAARRFQKPDRQLNDMIASRKAFGEKVARDMERSYDPARPAGWLDLPSGCDSTPQAAPDDGGELLRRYHAADPATRALIDIALAGDAEPLPAGLSPSLRVVSNAHAQGAIGTPRPQAPSPLVQAAMRLDTAPHVTQGTRDAVVVLLDALAQLR